MKKIFLLLLLVCSLTACDVEVEKDIRNEERYFDLVELIRGDQKFKESSEYFDISTDMAKIDNGYRYYIFIDNPRIAMYDIEAMALVDGIDYNKVVAPSVGVLEEVVYNMIPNQTNLDKNYVKGIVLSGDIDRPNADIKMNVQWKDKTHHNTYGEYYSFNIHYNENNEENIAE